VTFPQEQKYGENIGFLPLDGSFQELEAVPKVSAKSHQAHKANTLVCKHRLMIRLPLAARKCLFARSQRKDGIIVTI